VHQEWGLGCPGLGGLAPAVSGGRPGERCSSSLRAEAHPKAGTGARGTCTGTEPSRGGARNSASSAASRGSHNSASSAGTGLDSRGSARSAGEDKKRGSNPWGGLGRGVRGPWGGAHPTATSLNKAAGAGTLGAGTKTGLKAPTARSAAAPKPIPAPASAASAAGPHLPTGAQPTARGGAPTAAPARATRIPSESPLELKKGGGEEKEVKARSHHS